MKKKLKPIILKFNPVLYKNRRPLSKPSIIHKNIKTYNRSYEKQKLKKEINY